MSKYLIKPIAQAEKLETVNNKADHKNRCPQAVFLDRDGTIGGSGKLVKPDDFVLYPYSLEAIGLLKQNRIKVYSLTNQPGISRGETKLSLVREQLMAYGFDKIYICPHTDQDNCQCRKPKPGMLFGAAAENFLDLTCCFVIGDSWRDMLAADAAGTRKILLKTGDGEVSYRRLQDMYSYVSLDYYAKDLYDAVKWIIGRKSG